MPVGAKMQGCSGFLLKKIIETKAKWNRKKKKNGTLALALQFQGAVALAGRPAKLEFLLGLS